MIPMQPFDHAWRLLKSFTSGRPHTKLSERTGQPHGYVPFGHTSLPGADIGVTDVPQESDEDFREHAKKKLNNGECRLIGLGEKRTPKPRVKKMKQLNLGDF